MIEPGLLELIHADLDGLLDAAAAAELRQRLQGDPEARAMHEQLGRMFGALGRLAPAAPPAALQQQILQALPAGASVLPFRRRRQQFLRYAMALAASVLIATVGIVSFGGSGRLGLDTDQLVATMALPASAPARAATQIALQAPGLAGSVALRPVDGGWRLQFELASRRPVTVTAAYSDAAFRFIGYAQGNPAVGAFSATPGRIQFVSQGPQRLDLLLQPGTGGALRISVREQGKLLQEAVLELPGPGQQR